MSVTIDGTAIGSYGTPFTVALTTAGANDFIVIVVVTYGASFAAAPSVSSISGGGLMWFRRAASGSIGYGPGYGYTVNLETWWAQAGAPLSATMTIALTGAPSRAGYALAFGVNSSGNLAWDANGSLPALASSTVSATPSVSGVSTSRPVGLLFGFQANGANIAVGAKNYPGTGFTIIYSGGSDPDGQYQSLSSIQSGITVSFGTSETGGTVGFVMYADAITLLPVPSSTGLGWDMVGQFVFRPAPKASGGSPT